MATDTLKSATRSLQEYLRSRGFVGVRVDGTFGPITASAAERDGSDLATMLVSHVQASTPRVTPRAAPVADQKVVAKVRAECRRQGVAYGPTAAIVAHESGWDHSARSPQGAVGLFQLTSWPIKQYNLDVNPRYPFTMDDRFDIDVNIKVGVWYLKYCAKQMAVDPMSESPDDWARIYGAYNLGPGAMRFLLSGRYDHPVVRDAWAGQSALLKEGGIQRYESNARSLFV